MDNLLKRFLISIFLIPLTFFIIIEGSYLFIFFTILCFCITIYEWYMMTRDRFYCYIGCIFILFSFYIFYRFRIELNFGYVLFITLICVFTDLGGYLFGKILKGPKLTKISPKKTYAGLIGGFLLPLSSLIFLKKMNIILIEIDFLSLKIMLFTFLISLISQLGDIFISYFKRKAKIKDTGKILPGHGGLLDRIDGMIFAYPISYILLKLSIFNLY